MDTQNFTRPLLGRPSLENRNNVLFIGGCSTLDLVKAYDTPLYVYDEDRIRQNYRTLFQAFSRNYQKFRLHYAMKANTNPAILAILRQEGAGIDASCTEEIYLAEQAGFPKEDILYSGVYHRDDELAQALQKGVPINLEDISQIDRLFALGSTTFLSLRVNPGIGKGSFAGNVFAGKEAKFGIPEHDVLEAYRKAKAAGVERFGMHMMTGSCVLDEDYFAQVTEKLMDIAGSVASTLHIQFELIDIGGGFGVPYLPGEKELDIPHLVRKVCETFKEKIRQYGLGEPFLLIEPGRYLVCDAGILLTKVQSINSLDRLGRD